MSALWEIQRAGFKLATGAIKLSGKAAARAGSYSVEQIREDRARRMVAGGAIGPGDGPPPPGSSVLDYRGLASPRELALPQDGLPLGELLDIKRGGVGPAALPMAAVLRHACVIGPSGSGKTHSMMVPWTVALLAAGCSVVSIDVKGDLFQEIQGYLANSGSSIGAQAFVWDYSSSSSHRWNFLQEITNDQGIDAAVVSVLGRQKENDSQPYFYQRDYRWLKGLIRLAREIDGAKAQPRMLIDLLADPDILGQVAPFSNARAELSDLIALNPSDFSTYVSGLLNALALFQEPAIQRATAVSDFKLDHVAQAPTLLIGVAKMSDGRRAEQMSSLILSQFTQSVLDRFGGHSPRPVVLMIDEAPRLKERLDLEQMLSVARGANAGVVLAAQDVAQFGTEQQQSALLANCHTYVSMYGVSHTSADYLSKRLGTRMREEVSSTRNGNRKFLEADGRSRQTTLGPVLGPSEIMFPPGGSHTAIVHCSSLSPAPFMVDLER